ncbi:MAG: hypothetical protein JOZ62_22945, partial [Acidobacteriaceae bacterium]|nr:hypothetical protein [Acidobacteriaceae bacterium]
MAKRFVFLLLLAVGSSAAPWPTDIASYRIDATLDAKQKAVDGSELLTWRNDSGDGITELQFHLYMNAFRNNESTLMRESGGSLRLIHARKNTWGFITVNRLQLVGGPDLTRAIEFIHPDDDNTEDRTVFRVALPTTIAPHRTIQLRIEFHAQFPHVFARSGYHGDFLLAGQWFPKIGVYEHAGERYASQGQWNCHQYHATSEFYADFGTYDVNLTVPSNEVIGATGVMVKKETFGSTTRYSFHQDRVHDFAWTVQPSFVRVERLFRASEEVSPTELRETAARLGITPDEARLTDVRMILLIQPEHASQMDRRFRAVRSAIKYFGLWYGGYPYHTITFVDPPYGAEGHASDRHQRPYQSLAQNRFRSWDAGLLQRKKCRCQPCRTANREYERERAEKLARGITTRVIPARRVRDHLFALSAQGIGYKTVGDAAKVGKTILQEVRSGRRKHVREETERRVLAVKAEGVTHDRILVDAAPTRKLIDELTAEGYAKAQLARWLGSKTPALQIAHRDKVRARTALDVKRLYIRLKGEP